MNILVQIKNNIFPKWNNIIITNRINPLLCFKGVEPIDGFMLGIKLEQEYNLITGEIMIIEYKSNQNLESLVEIQKLEMKQLQLKYYLKYLSTYKNIKLNWK